MTSTPRYHYLDALRSFAMLYGVLLHGATIGRVAGDRIHAFRAILGETSSLFRMSTFFAISGFFTIMALQKYGTREMLSRRSILIAVPFFTVVIVLNPMTNYLVYTWHNGEIGVWQYLIVGGVPNAKGPMVWHLHLWFLASLLVYTMVAPRIHRFVARNATFLKVISLLGQLPHWAVAFFIATGIAVMAVGSRAIFIVSVEPFVMGGPFEFISKITVHYFWFFALGAIMYSHPLIFSAMLRLNFFNIFVAFFCFIVSTKSGPIYGDTQLNSAFELFWRTFANVTAFSILLCLFGKLFGQHNRYVRFVTDAAYTVYLLHYFVIYVVAHILVGFLHGSIELYLMAVFFTFAITLVVHRHVITAYPITRLLLNGKKRRIADKGISQISL